MSTVRKAIGSRGARAAAATAIAGGLLAGVGIAGAAEQADVTINAVGEADGSWDQPAVTIQTGDTVTWSFTGTVTHNVASANSSDTDPRWEPFAYKGEYQAVQDDSSIAFQFATAGTYEFACQFHPAMTGTITVEGEDVPPPEETPPPEEPPPPGGEPPPPGQQPSPPGGGTPPPDDHTTTPAPGGGGGAGADSTKPALSRVKLKGIRRGAKVRFRLSEAATVTLDFRRRGSRRVVKAARLQAGAGTRTVRVRSRALRKGRYTVTLRARDAMGNRSSARRSALRVRR